MRGHRSSKTEWPPLREALGQVEAGMVLSDVNLLLIRYLTSALLPRRNIKIWRSSTISCQGDATERIVSICRHIGASGIIVGGGASLAPNVHDISRLRASGLKIAVQDFLAANVSYFQVRRQRLPFAAGVSSIDAILNIGSVETSRLLELSVLCPTKLYG
jgi:hypothetical protein